MCSYCSFSRSLKRLMLSLVLKVAKSMHRDSFVLDHFIYVEEMAVI